MDSPAIPASHVISYDMMLPAQRLMMGVLIAVFAKNVSRMAEEDENGMARPLYVAYNFGRVSTNDDSNDSNRIYVANVNLIPPYGTLPKVTISKVALVSILRDTQYSFAAGDFVQSNLTEKLVGQIDGESRMIAGEKNVFVTWFGGVNSGWRPIVQLTKVLFEYLPVEDI